MTLRNVSDTPVNLKVPKLTYLSVKRFNLKGESPKESLKRLWKA